MCLVSANLTFRRGPKKKKKRKKFVFVFYPPLATRLNAGLLEPKPVSYDYVGLQHWSKGGEAIKQKVEEE